MLNLTLYKYEMKNSLKLMVIFLAVITMYVTIIISMYDPEMMATLDAFAQAMPELMAAMGMNVTFANTLMEFMISYLYGFILLIFPMVFTIIRANGLIAKYTDNGSMVSLVASKVSRVKIALTQLLSLITCIIIIIAYATIFEVITANIFFEN
ncbi:MAG: ABC transporter permease, partial [Erysipelotrichaceae bacterium]